jgi:hypothetical protein
MEKEQIYQAIKRHNGPKAMLWLNKNNDKYEPFVFRKDQCQYHGNWEIPEEPDIYSSTDYLEDQLCRHIVYKPSLKSRYPYYGVIVTDPTDSEIIRVYFYREEVINS